MGGTGQAAVAGWDRRRLLVVLAAVVAAGMVLLVGLGYAVYVTLAPAAGTTKAASATTAAQNNAVTQHSSGSQVNPGSQAGQAAQGLARRNEIAAAPMLAVRPADAQPSTPAAVPGPSITIPAATTAGPALVPAGFPHTPEGAVAQLAAIETTVLDAMSIAGAKQVYEAWALPGGVGVAGWEITKNVQAFLGTARMGPEKDITTTVVATPAAAQIKGTDGPDWVLACVLLQVRATITVDAVMGYGYCEAMAWTAGRWMIAPGTPPARAPSTWPGSDLSIKAGWATWVGGVQE